MPLFRFVTIGLLAALTATSCRPGSCHPFVEPSFPGASVAGFCGPDYYKLRLEVVLQPPSSAPAGTQVGGPVQMRVVSNFQNFPNYPVKDVEVTFAITGGVGTFALGNRTEAVKTDDNGLVSAPVFTLDPNPGPNQLTVTISGFTVANGAKVAPITQRTGSPTVFDIVGSPRTANSMVADSWSGGAAAAGAALSSPPAVKVTDAAGPVAGTTVTFTVTQGGGSITGPSAVTDAQGVARVGSWTLGTLAGTNNNAVQATSPGLAPVQFVISATAGAPDQLSKASPDNLTAAPGAVVTPPPAVRLVDRFGNPIVAATIDFAVGPTGGSVGAATAQTDATGVARVTSWTLGTTIGEYTLTATAPGTVANSPQVFRANAAPPAGPPTTMSAAWTQPTGLIVGQPVPQNARPRVQITDANGVGVANVTIAFALGVASGTVTGTTQTTDAGGFATLGGWTLGTLAGTQYLFANAPTGSGIAPAQIVFQLVALPDVMTNLVKVAGDGVTAAAGSTLTGLNVPTVRVVDRFGNGIQGVVIGFAALTAGTSVTPASVTTDPQGNARVNALTLSGTPGANQVRATATLAPAVTLVGNPALFTVTGAVVDGISRR